MDHLRQIDEDLKSLSAEAKKKYPEVKDSVDKALASLKTIREIYIAEMMRKSSNMKISKFPQSSDICHPYILASNYADANHKIVTLALTGIHMLLNFDLVPYGDIKNILRVLNIQATANNASKSDIQLKMLQILLQIVNLLSRDSLGVQYMTETTIQSLLTLSIQLCDNKSSVTTSQTALAASRQVVSMIMDEASKVYATSTTSSSSSSTPAAANLLEHATMDQATSSFSICARLLIRDMCLLLAGEQSEWIRGAGVTLPIFFALDTLHEILTNWKHLFQEVPSFRCMLTELVCPALRAQVRELQSDFVTAAAKTSLTSAAAGTSRRVRLVRTVVLNFMGPDTTADCGMLLTLLIHALQPGTGPGIGVTAEDSPQSRTINNMFSSPQAFDDVLRARLDDATALFTPGGAQAFLSRLAVPAVPTGRAALNQLPGGACLALVNVGPTSLSTTQSNVTGSSSTACQLPAHPAGACLETLLSFFLSDMSVWLSTGGSVAARFLESSLTHTLLSVCQLLSGGLSVESNCRDFESITRSSQLVTLLEGVLSGAETDLDYVLRCVHELLINCSSIAAAEVLILAFELLQVGVRLLVQCTLKCVPLSSGQVAALSGVKGGAVFLSAAVLNSVGETGFISTLELRSVATNVCENVSDNVQETCQKILSAVDQPAVVRRGLGILTELALSTGLLGLRQHSNSVVAALCKLTTPRWHGQELMTSEQCVATAVVSPAASAGQAAAVAVSVSPCSNQVRWRHVIAVVRLVQIVHVLADIISDWEVVVDAFEQLVSLISQSNRAAYIHDEVTIMETTRILAAIMRFKSYTVNMSDESLVRLMSSLVAQSLNNLAVTAGGSTLSRNPQVSQVSSGINTASTAAELAGLDRPLLLALSTTADYMASGIGCGLISFSLQDAIEITKSNAYRVSCIWQMVTSHLRMVASQKSVRVRAVAVSATHDLILAALTQMHQPGATVIISECLADDFLALPPATLLLSDETLFNGLFPSFETAFVSRQFHRLLLLNRVEQEKLSEGDHKLSECDLLSSLSCLAGSCGDDVRVNVVNGLQLMLQNDGQVVHGGWHAILDLLSLVASSLHPAAVTRSEASHDEDKSDDGSSTTVHPWPKLALTAAFACAKLIVDEFIDSLSTQLIKSMIGCLSNFGTQTADVNISLTAVEMLWKVTDLVTSRQHTGEGSQLIDISDSALEVAMRSLLDIASDVRPEIRHCAMNSLFTLLVANANKLTSRSWDKIFVNFVFPILERSCGQASQHFRDDAVAAAAAVARSDRLTVHHSRDTGQKQWAETGVLGLRGLVKVMKACTKLLFVQVWFQATWQDVMTLCDKAVDVRGEGVEEVCLAAMDCLFGMLRVAANVCAERGADKAGAIYLWDCAWAGVQQAALFQSSRPEVALHFCQALFTCYQASVNNEFAKIDNFGGLVNILATISRPRRAPTGGGNKAVETQLLRAIADFFVKLRRWDDLSNSIWVCGVCEICFANQYVMADVQSNSQLLLKPCADKLRSELSDLLIKTLRSPCMTNSSRSWQTMVSRRFVLDLCDVCLTSRSLKNLSTCGSNLSSSEGAVLPVTVSASASPAAVSSNKGYSGFFSSIGKLLSPAPAESMQPVSPSGQSCTPDAFSLHRFRSCAYPADGLEVDVPNQNCFAWKTFYPLVSEMKVLLTSTGVVCASSDNGLDCGTVALASCSSLTTVLGCVLSPWRATCLAQTCLAELTCSAAQDFSSDVKQFVRDTFNQAIRSSSQDSECGSAAAPLLTVIDVTFTSCRLAVFAVSQSYLASVSPVSESVLAFRAFYESLWGQVLVSLLAVASGASVTSGARCAAARALMQLTADLCNCSCQHLSSSSQSPPGVMFSAATMFLEKLRVLEMPLQLVPWALEPLLPETALLDHWAAAQQGATADHGKITASPGASDEFSNICATLRTRAHLAVLTPVLGRVLSTASMSSLNSHTHITSTELSRLLTVATDIVTEANIPELLNTIVSLLKQNSELNATNTSLTSELFSVRAAATLNF